MGSSGKTALVCLVSVILASATTSDDSVLLARLSSLATPSDESALRPRLSSLATPSDESSLRPLLSSLATPSDESALRPRSSSLASPSDESSLRTHLSSSVTSDTNEHVSGKSLQQFIDTCLKDADCLNGGNCIRDWYNGNYCQCNNGTSGDTCEVVDGCVSQPMMCGIGTDVKCGYDLETQEAKCKCTNDSKEFDSYVMKCRVPCISREDCPDKIRCRNNPGDDQTFCRCPWSVGGDRCTDDIDECKERGLDCGNNTLVTCEEGKKGAPFCYCSNWSVAFNYQVKDCVECKCGGSNLGCQYFPNGTKQCYCQGQSYQEDGKCKDCNCGYGSNGCKLVNGKKECDCWRSYLDNNGVCEKCDCGPNQKSCTFKGGQKSCSCESGYIQSNGTCRKYCSDWFDVCEHGGKCVASACQCLPGTQGDVCEIIDGCETLWDKQRKCGYTDTTYCDFNETSLEAYCACKNKAYLYDTYGKECKSCNCGKYGNCSFVYGRRTCKCNEGYAEKPSLSTWYEESKCEPCDCGPGSSKCTLTSSGKKSCVCKNGYSLRDGKCVVCDCGLKGQCSFDFFGKVCKCSYGYVEKNGYCTECNCGFNGACEFDVFGRKKCNCKSGYGDNDGECTDCSCWLDYKTTINCTFTYGIKKCLCPEGYKAEYYTCKDINECLDKSICPPNTSCKNTPGSYNCTCDYGYRPFSDKQDPKHFGCTKMNQCLEKNACRYRDTSECVNNMDGSYYCRCKSGYVSSYSSYYIENNGCQEDQTGWRTGYIILLVVVILTAIGLVVAIIKKRLSS